MLLFLLQAEDVIRDHCVTGVQTCALPISRWRPVGLGLMGLQDVFFALRLPFDSDEARELSTRVSEEIYLTALEVSCELAERDGPHPSYDETRAAAGVLQP